MPKKMTLDQQSEAEEARDRAKFSAEQVLRAYAPEDAIYEQLKVEDSSSSFSSLSRTHAEGI